MMLSNIELVEQVKSLSPRQRVLYSVSLSVSVALVFLLALLLAVVLAVLFAAVLVGVSPNLGDVLITALPVFVAFLLALGFTGGGSRVIPPAGLTFRQAARSAARRGLINGVITGVIAGAIWTLISQVVFVRYYWIARFDIDTLLLHGAMLAVALAPTMALVGAFTAVIEHVILRRFQNIRR